MACEVYEHKRMAFPLVLPSTRSFVSSDEKRPLQKTDTRFYFHFSKSDFLLQTSNIEKGKTQCSFVIFIDFINYFSKLKD